MEQQTKKRWYQTKGFNQAMNIGGGALDFGFTYYDQRQKGHGVAFSALAGGTVAAAWAFLPGLMWAKTALDMGKAAGGAMESIRRDAWEKQFAANDMRGVIGNGFVDTEMGATSRQRGLQAIQASRINARSALANEARSLHRF